MKKVKLIDYEVYREILRCDLHNPSRHLGIQKAINLLDMIPKIDIDCLIPHGHNTGEERIFKCSECGYGVMDIYQSDERNYPVGEFNYCPHCGIKIVREK